MNFREFMNDEQDLIIRPLYFGSMNNDGHAVYEQSGARSRYASLNPGIQFLKKHDGALVPKNDQNQGAYAIHRYPEFTVIAIRDYTGDSRPGSNSMFLIPGQLNDAEVVLRAKSLFPKLWARIYNK